MTPDIICSKTSWAPGWWQISAGTARGRRWWVEQGYADIGWNLGSGSFDLTEVEQIVRDCPDGLVLEVNGLVRKTETVRLEQEVSHG